MRNLGDLLAAVVTADPQRVALVEGDERTTYGELADLAAEIANRMAGRTGDRFLLDGSSDRNVVATVLGAAQVGAAAAPVNPRLTEREQGALHGALAELAPDPDTAVVLFTAGTTGVPKPVPYTNAALLGRIQAFAQPAVDTPEMRLLCAPLFHVGGLLGLFVSLYAGHTIVVQPRFDAGEWLRLVSAHGVQVTFVVPTMLARIVDHPDFASTDLSSLTSITYGAAPMPADVLDRALAAMPHVGFTNTFGQTETLGGIAFLTPDDHRDPKRRGSVGQVMPGVVTQITDDGELLIGQKDGSWLATGDLVTQDPDGYLYVTGRLSDVVNRGGEKIAPLEVEAVIREHPAVRDVVVTAVPHADLGQTVAALVVGAGVTADDLTEWCRGRLSAYKVPERIRFVDVVPYTDVGKPDRRAATAAFDEGG